MKPDLAALPPGSPAGVREVRVWDPLVRVFHWGLVACVLGNQFVTEEGETAHEVLGYAALALVAVRIVWGFVGTRHARFADFWPTPSRIARHLQALKTGRHDGHDGHNPLGALMMLALIALVLATGITGAMLTFDAWWGSELIEDLHETLADTLIVFAGLHAAAAIVMSRLERTNLVAAMVTGIKRRRG